MIVRDLQRVVGMEAREQIQRRTGSLPDAVIACVGGGSNAIGAFHPFLADNVRLIGCEPAGAASMTGGREGVLHGARSFVLQDENGQPAQTHSISAGLDYAGVGPEHAHLRDIGRVEYRSVTDDEAMRAMRLLAETEGIIAAIESSHALAGALALGRQLDTVLVNVSGRGDKDMDTVASYFNLMGEQR
jgi:tryptophan synthase beta chain